jgi:hypothetical protein
MQDKPNDRPQAQPADQPDMEPKLFAVVDGEKFPRPALETMFADSEGAGVGAVTHTGGCSCNPVVYCACNKVASTKAVPTCNCVGHTTCSCVGDSGGAAYGCQCAPVH